ncbi:MAG: hypothetical protein AAGI06_19725 [Pseudomonadota bacterium]
MAWALSVHASPVLELAQYAGEVLLQALANAVVTLGLLMLMIRSSFVVSILMKIGAALALFRKI